MKLSEFIYKTLHEDEGITAVVGDRIYPIAVISGTLFPCIVFDSISIVGSYTKDGTDGDNSQVTIKCVSERNEDSSDLAIKVRKIMEQTDDDEFGSAELLGSASDYDQGYYVNMMTFQFTTY